MFYFFITGKGLMEFIVKEIELIWNKHASLFLRMLLKNLSAENSLAFSFYKRRHLFAHISSRSCWSSGPWQDYLVFPCEDSVSFVTLSASGRGQRKLTEISWTQLHHFFSDTLSPRPHMHFGESTMKKHWNWNKEGYFQCGSVFELVSVLEGSNFSNSN